MPLFTDCLTEHGLLLWAQIAHIQEVKSQDIVIDTKLESLPEIDRLIRIVPGFEGLTKRSNNA